MTQSPPGLLEWLSNEKRVRSDLGEPTKRIENAIRSARAGKPEAGLRLLKAIDPDLAALEGGNPMPNKAKTVSIEGMTISGNPEGVPLHEAMAGMADWLDYEANVVADAADEIDDPEIAAAADDQAEAMEEAAEALDEAADEARETAAEVFTETGTPQDEQEAEVVAGNATAPDGAVVEDTPAATPDAVERARVSSIETTAMGNPKYTLRSETVVIKDNPPVSSEMELTQQEVDTLIGKDGNVKDVTLHDDGTVDRIVLRSGDVIHGNPVNPSGDLNQGAEASGAGQAAVTGNPGGTDVAPGTAAPISTAVEKAPPPPEASPVPITASGHVATADSSPDPTHWYNRPLIRKA